MRLRNCSCFYGMRSVLDTADLKMACGDTFPALNIQKKEI